MLDTAVRSLDHWACLYALSDPVIETEHGITNTQIPKCVCVGLFIYLFIYLDDNTMILFQEPWDNLQIIWYKNIVIIYHISIV